MSNVASQRSSWFRYLGLFAFLILALSVALWADDKKDKDKKEAKPSGGTPTHNAQPSGGGQANHSNSQGGGNSATPNNTGGGGHSGPGGNSGNSNTNTNRNFNQSGTGNQGNIRPGGNSGTGTQPGNNSSGQRGANTYGPGHNNGNQGTQNQPGANTNTPGNQGFIRPGGNSGNSGTNNQPGSQGYGQSGPNTYPPGHNPGTQPGPGNQGNIRPDGNAGTNTQPGNNNSGQPGANTYGPGHNNGNQGTQNQPGNSNYGAGHNGPNANGPGQRGPGGNTTNVNVNVNVYRGGFGGGHFAGNVPQGHTVQNLQGGASFVRRPDGHVAEYHDPRRGMDIHHNFDGSRRVYVEHVDHTRVYVTHGGFGYVQRPYNYRGREYARRSYYYNGVSYNRYYARYYWRGVYINPYFPASYYRPAFYGWVYNPWAAPVTFSWGWGRAGWFGFYGGYFTPYPVYASPAFWLTDYVLSSSLEAAYADQQARAAASMNQPAVLTPETKAMIAEEVRRQIALENAEAQAGQSDPNYASSSIQRALTDGQTHVFVGGQYLDVTNAYGQECSLSEGDAVQLNPDNDPNSTQVNVIVLASKGGRECRRGDTVALTLDELQEMQNYMRATIDLGLAELLSRQGSGGLPPAPKSTLAPPVESAYAAIAPPPPPPDEVHNELEQQERAAEQAESEAGALPPPPPPQ